MSQLAKIFTITALAYSVSAFTLKADFLVADSSNLYTASTSCASTASNIFFGISGCSSGTNCVLSRGSSVRLSMGFTPPINMPELRVFYQVFKGSSFQELYYEEDELVPEHIEANQPFFRVEDHVVPTTVWPQQYKLILKILSTTNPTNPVVCIQNFLFTVV